MFRKEIKKRCVPVEDCVCFNSYHRDNYVLSNMFPCEMEYNGMKFKSVEMMYYWLMYEGEGEDRKRVREELLKCGGINNGFRCREIGKKNKEFIDENVANNEFKILRECHIAKLKGCREFREKLRESKGKMLVEEAGWDYKRYGAVLNKMSGCMEGGNACGRVMTKVRDEFLEGKFGEFDD